MITARTIRRVRRALADLDDVGGEELADARASLRQALEARDEQTFSALVRFSAEVVWAAAARDVPAASRAAWWLRRAAESCPRAWEARRVLPRPADHRRAVLSGLVASHWRVLH